jgi:hypothetical protein
MMDNYTDSKPYYSQQLSGAFLATPDDNRMTANRMSSIAALCKNATSLSYTGRSGNRSLPRIGTIIPSKFFSTEAVDNPVHSRYTTALSYRFFTAIDDMPIF